MVENTGYKKYFGLIIFTFCVYIVMCSVIIALEHKIAAADYALGQTTEDFGYYFGIAASILVGYGLSGLGVIFSIVSIAAGAKKPELIKGFGIGIFVFLMIAVGIMGGGLAGIGSALTNVINCAKNNSSAAWRANCQEDIVSETGILVVMVIMDVTTIIGIVGCVKVVSTVNKIIPSVSSKRTQIATPQQGTSQVQGKPKYCSSCGTPNDENAEFCKNCANPFK